MTQVIVPVGPSKARANRMRWWWQVRMGWAGAAALAALTAAGALAVAVRPAFDAKREALMHEQIVRLDALAQQRAKALHAEPVGADESLVAMIPSLARRGEVVARLMDLVAASGVTFDGAEYASADQEPNLSRLKVALPFSGSYAQTRGVIARVLNGLPNAALDSVEIERPSGETKALEGTLRLSIYFRKETP